MLNLGTAHAAIEVRLDRLEAGLAKAERDFASTGKKIEAKSAEIKRNLTQTFGDLGRTLTIGLTAPLVGLGTAAVKAAVEMDSLKRGLRAVAGSSQEAERQLKRLKEVAKLPGLGFNEAIAGSTRLQAAGLSAKQAEKALLGFGNALASVGRGKADLDGVITALSQIQSKGVISAEEINQIAERVPQIRRIMVDAFGTANTEILQKAKLTSTQFIDAISSSLEKLPRVTGGAQNSFENFSDAAKRALTAIGDTLLPSVTRALEKFTPILENIASGFGKMGNISKGVLGGLAVGGAIIGPALIGLSALITAIGNVNKALAGSALGRLLGGAGRVAGAAAAPLALGALLEGTIGQLPEDGRMSPEVREQARRDRAKNKPFDDMRRMQELQRQIGQYNSRRNIIGTYPREDRLRLAAQQRERIEELKGMFFGPAGAPGGKGPAGINAAARAAAATAAKEAAEEAKRFAKEQAEARKRNAVEMAAFQNKFAGQRVEARQDYLNRIPLLGEGAASTWLKSRLAEIKKDEDAERKALNESHQRKLDDAHKRALAISVASQQRNMELAKAEVEFNNRMREEAEAKEKKRIDFLGNRLRSLYERVREELDRFTQQMLESQAEAQTAVEGMYPGGKPVGMSNRRPDVPFDNPLARPESADEMASRLERTKDSLRRSLGGHIGIEIGYSFADSFAQGIEKALGGGGIGKTIARGFARWMDKEIGNMLDSLFSKLAKGKGGLGGIAGPSGIGGLLGSVVPLIGLGGAIGGLFKGLKFAEGGWVPGPIGMPQPATVHGGEFVVSRKMMEGGMGGGVNINFGGVTVAGDYDVDRMMDRVAWHAKNRLAVNPGSG